MIQDHLMSRMGIGYTLLLLVRRTSLLDNLDMNRNQLPIGFRQDTSSTNLLRRSKSSGGLSGLFGVD